ncbi:MAG: type II toxin-antitoxin system RelE/ParE family toxin [Rhodospirillales bacterium]|nr:type II toxin-antitoxin system RelE/ParE family toxin [Rhodospirillales bacterium]
MRLLQTPTFKRTARRLHKQQKQELDEAVRAIAADPSVGEVKTGDLAGVRVFKFNINKRLTLLAYELHEAEGNIKLLALGSHENFYRDLKRRS